jgi:hypothetical protein
LIRILPFGEVGTSPGFPLVTFFCGGMSACGGECAIGGRRFDWKAVFEGRHSRFGRDTYARFMVGVID